ncbi:MAG: endonuclease MutS2, partial [Dehalococcoidia bacterium]|nr:endonuclease MutS2 [Dehalococcoidia bacterium]
MDVKTLEMLEFHRVREIIAEFTSFSLSRDMSLNLQPSSDFEQVSLLLRQSAEARRLLSLQPDLSAGEISDIREVVKMAAQGKVLEPQALLEIQQTLSASRRLRGNLSKLRGNLPLLWNIAQGIVELPQIEKSITACITAAGQLQDSASPRLANIRRGLREAREQLIDHLESIIRSPRGHKIVREPIITEREGRYVIPIKIESRKEIKGIVHDVSNTGVTLFVEPWTTVEQGNQLRELVTEERREIERILRDLSIGVAAHESEIIHNVALAAELDLALAK